MSHQEMEALSLHGEPKSWQVGSTQNYLSIQIPISIACKIDSQFPTRTVESSGSCFPTIETCLMHA